MSSAALTIDFFHDVVCCWCFNISSRLRLLAEEMDLAVQHRTFVLQASVAEMQSRWGSPEQARAAILEHWDTCRRVSDRPDRIDIDAMRRARFDYPHGMTAALACKAAEFIGGQPAHWAMFDRIQAAHLSEARNIADRAVLRDVAAEAGLDPLETAWMMDDPKTGLAVEADRQYARVLQVRSIPAIVVRETGTRLVNGPIDDLRAQLRAARRLVA